MAHITRRWIVANENWAMSLIIVGDFKLKNRSAYFSFKQILPFITFKTEKKSHWITYHFSKTKRKQIAVNFFKINQLPLSWQHLQIFSRLKPKGNLWEEDTWANLASRFIVLKYKRHAKWYLYWSQLTSCYELRYASFFISCMILRTQIQIWYERPIVL